jgi:hypothetical protein
VQQLGRLIVFKEHLLVTCSGNDLLVLDPDSIALVGVADELRGVLDFAVTKDEIFVLEGSRSLLRLACQPEAKAASIAGSERPVTSPAETPLTASAVSSLKEFSTKIPFQKILNSLSSPFQKHNTLEQPALAVEAVELPPLVPLDSEISLSISEINPRKNELLEPIGHQEFEEVLFRGRRKKKVGCSLKHFNADLIELYFTDYQTYRSTVRYRVRLRKLQRGARLGQQSVKNVSR